MEFIVILAAYVRQMDIVKNGTADCGQDRCGVIGHDATRPVYWATEPIGKTVEVLYRERSTVSQALEEGSAACDDGSDSRQRFATLLVYPSLVSVGDRCQCVPVCVRHDTLVRDVFTVVNGTYTARVTFRCAS